MSDKFFVIGGVIGLALKHKQSLERGAVSEQVGIHHRSDEIISERGHDTGFENYLPTLVCRDGEKQQ